MFNSKAYIPYFLYISDQLQTIYFFFQDSKIFEDKFLQLMSGKFFLYPFPNRYNKNVFLKLLVLNFYNCTFFKKIFFQAHQQSIFNIQAVLLCQLYENMRLKHIYIYIYYVYTDSFNKYLVKYKKFPITVEHRPVTLSRYQCISPCCGAR